MKKKLTATIDHTTIEKLKLATKQCALTQSMIVEEALEAHLDRTSRWIKRNNAAHWRARKI